MKRISALEIDVKRAQDAMTAAFSHANDLALISPKSEKQVADFNAADKKALALEKKFETAIDALENFRNSQEPV